MRQSDAEECVEELRCVRKSDPLALEGMEFAEECARVLGGELKRQEAQERVRGYEVLGHSSGVAQESAWGS